MATKKKATKLATKKPATKKVPAKKTATKSLRDRKVKPGKVVMKKTKTPAKAISKCSTCDKMPLGSTQLVALLLGVIVSLSLVLLTATYTIKLG